MSWKQAGDFAFLPALDPLWRHTPTPIEARYNVLGIPLALATNAPFIGQLANEVFGDWGVPEQSAGATPEVRLRVLLHDADEAQGELPLLCRAHEGYLLLSRGASMGFGDRPNGTGAAFITSSLLAEPEIVRTCFIECLGIFLVCRFRRATLHAAAVIMDGRCVLLTGENGAGKSTLAYACLRAGCRLVAEDIVFAEPMQDTVQAWGNPWNLHLMPDAVRFFPELRDAGIVKQMNGERKLRISVPKVRPGAAVTHWPIWGVCSLGRSQSRSSRMGTPNLTQIHHALTHFKEDPLLDRAAMRAAADRLVAGRVAHLEVGEPVQAVETLRAWMNSA